MINHSLWLWKKLIIAASSNEQQKHTLTAELRADQIWIKPHSIKDLIHL